MNDDTIVAPITPLVTAPVITVRISGSKSLNVFSAMRTARGSTPKPVPNMMRRYIFEAKKDGLKDDVLAVYFKAPHSYTGEDVVEISFHGNPIIVASALSAIYDMGIRRAEPGEFSKRAFLNGKMDLTQAEAVQELISAGSEASVRHAYGQLDGNVRQELSGMKDRLLDVKAVLEARLDFPDEETGEDDNKDILDGVRDVLKRCRTLLASYRRLRAYRQGFSVVIAGKPNVGKSSLLNALLREERAIVSDVPGTTRDYIKEDLYIGGVPIRIVDTAGLREAGDDLESEGVRRSLSKINSADLILLVLDVSSALDDNDALILNMTKDKERIIIGNKSDLSRSSLFKNADVFVSAAKNKNIDKLTEIIKERTGILDSEKISGIVSVTERHAHALSGISDILTSLLDDFNDRPLDMVAMDIESAVCCLEEITGEKYTEEVLSRIFSKFCIGK